VVAGNLNWNTGIYGGNTEYFLIRDWKIRSGEFFTEVDVKAGSKVCLIGRTVELELFPDGDPVGQTIRIGNLPFKVIGTLAPKGQNTMGMDQDDIIVAPFTTVQRKVLRQDHVGTILMSAIRQNKIIAAQQEVTELLRIRHRLAEWQDDDFTVRTQTDIATAATATTDIMTSLLGSIASVSLLVGGIGIMNIMLVSVTERTREIGVRMSIGARRRDILGQFLTEAITLSILGGLIGVAVGLIASNLISGLAGWVILISPDSVVLAFLFAILVGVFFGFYPAQKASRLNPIEALRYE
jgi:putative ABC transport system permease protein